MKKIMLSALAAILGFGCFQDVEARGAAGRSTVQQKQAAAKQQQLQQQQLQLQQQGYVPTQGQYNTAISGQAYTASAATGQAYQRTQSVYIPATTTGATITDAAGIVSYINTQCAFSNVSGWPIGLKDKFRSLAKAITANNATDMIKYLDKIAGSKSNKNWNNAAGKIKPVRDTVLGYFNANAAIYSANGVLAKAQTSLADY